jgi:hypothetical protein
VVDASVDIGLEIAEEWQREGGDGEGTLSVPLVQGIIKLLGGSKGGQVPV